MPFSPCVLGIIARGDARTAADFGEAFLPNTELGESHATAASGTTT